MDTFDDAMSYTKYDISCQVSDDDSEEVLDGSKDQCLQDLSFEVEVETCGDIDIARASISSIEKHRCCISDAEWCEVDSTHAVSDLVVGSSNSICYHIAVSEIESLHKRQGLQRHHVTS